MNAYEERQAAKAERLRERAETKRSDGEARIGAATQFFWGLNGQPMLPGHHSFRADVNRRAKHRAKLDKGYELTREADRLVERAARVGSAGVASDDPDAVVKLQAKLEYVDAERERIKAVNKIVRRFAPKMMPGDGYDPVVVQQALFEAGFDEGTVREALTADFTGRVGIEGWRLTNLTAEAARLRERIADMEAMLSSDAVNGEWCGAGWQLWTDYDAGRIFLEVDGRLSGGSFRAVRSAGGFNWSRRDERFVRKLTPNGLRVVEGLVDRLDGLIDFDQ